MDVILGTAGHIDHGKTTLVQALTGINCDRLAEEQRRGITIELGFAWLDLASGQRVGIVDVPGHERFIKNMVAGASGVDVVLLVIAADEGVMPQTREHLEICSLLGAKRGLVALTKTDLVDQELLELARDEVTAFLKGTFLESAPIVPVSAATGQGLDQLRNEIGRLVAMPDKRETTELLRLPVDRVFSLKGFGTVVTGTMISGTCSQGEQLSILPAGRLARCRSLQVHGAPVEMARAGQRCAINLQGLELEEVQRGDEIARPGTLFPSRRWIVRLRCLASSPLPLRQNMEVHLHHGAREGLAKIALRGRSALEPGQWDLAEIKFKQPVVGVYEDHFVLRAHSPLRTVGGGIILNPLPPVLNRRTENLAEKWQLLRELAAPDPVNPQRSGKKTPQDLLRICLELYPAPGVSIVQLRVLTALSDAELAQGLEKLQKHGEAFAWDGGAAWTSNAVMQKCLEMCAKRARDLHDREPLKSFFAPDALTAGWGADLPYKFIQEVLNTAIQRGILAQQGTGLKLARHETRFSQNEHRVMATIQERIKAGGATPPFIKTLLEEFGWEAKKVQPVLQYLSDSGLLLRIQDGVYYDPEEFAALAGKIRARLEENETIEVGDLKGLLGISRKYAIPLLEYLDSIRMTYRAGNQRRLRKG